MSDIITDFPRRPLRILETGVWPGIASYISGLAFLALAGFIAYWQVPGIVNDLIIAQNPVVVDDSIIEDGECGTSRGFFVDCSAHVTYTVKSKTFERDIELMFVDFGTGDYLVDVVRSGDQPQLVTLSLGLDMLWNRIIVGAIFIAFIAAIGIGLFFVGARADRVRRLARTPSTLSPVPVAVTAVDKVIGGKKVTYMLPGQEGKKRAATGHSRMKKQQEPFWLDPESGAALAVLPEGGKVPVLMDAALSRLDLTAAERQRLTP